MRLYFVRHGESIANLLCEFSNSGFKHPLTENGLQQARLLARSLSGLHVAQIYSSPVMRAMQTAHVLAETLHASVAVAEALREWSVGIYEGTTAQAGWDLHRQVQEYWFLHHRLDSKMPGGESFLEIQARFVPFIEKLVQEQPHVDRTVVLVAHAGLYLAMLPVILNNVDHALASQLGFPYTACIVAETRPDSLTCLSWCGTPLDA